VEARSPSMAHGSVVQNKAPNNVVQASPRVRGSVLAPRACARSVFGHIWVRLCSPKRHALETLDDIWLRTRTRRPGALN